MGFGEAHTGPATVALTEGCVYVGGERVYLTSRENDVLTAIAISGKPQSTDALLESVWPDEDPVRTRLSLKVYVHRLRRRLTNPNFLLCDRSLWSLGDGVRVDVFEWRNLARNVSGQLAPQELSELQVGYNRLLAGLPGIYARSPLVNQVDLLFQQVLHDVGTRIVDDAVGRRAFGRAIAIAREMNLMDPLADDWEAAVADARLKLSETVSFLERKKRCNSNSTVSGGTNGEQGSSSHVGSDVRIDVSIGVDWV